jgi:hypothetical protein
MQARIPHPIRRLRTAAPRRGPRPVEWAEAPAPVATAPKPVEARVREAGGPEDSARYTCSCGMVFQASVSASVACPHCGSHQDW